MGIFRRKASKGNAAIKQMVAKGIASTVCKAQGRWVSFMERLSARLPMRVKVILLCGYLGCMVAACGYSIVKSIVNWNQSSIVQRESKMPEIKSQQQVTPQPLASDPVQKRIESFQYQLDSLAKTYEGRQQRDSLLRARPGLMDSIQKVTGLGGGH